MAPIFAKRLTCFYCGGRSSQTEKGPIRKWRCNACEAINYLDEKGQITDPPATVTNPNVYGPDVSSTPFESTDFTGTGLFCAQCIRHQHLFTSALAAYFPPADDPNYGAYEQEYPKFRKNLEERYPQVCAKCEPRVKERIRQAGYEAKSDHLRRMMDRSKAGRAARHARRWNWRSLLLFAGAISYWASVAGQLSWDLLGALAADESLSDPDDLLSSASIIPCIHRTLQMRQLPSLCSVDLAPYAGLSLVAGILSVWYNPKLRLKLEGRGGRFAGLGEYYQVQLIVMVMRCVFWALLRDPSSSGLQSHLPPALHTFMFIFTALSVLFSRRIVQYDTRPLVNWTDNTPAATPIRRRQGSPMRTTASKKLFASPEERLQQSTPRFPLEKLATPRPALEEPTFPTPPPEGDDMDWTPSVQHNITPTVSVHQREQKSILDGPLPFYGSLPAAPKPPSWNLRNQSAQRQKPIEKVVERNPFHRTPTQSLSSWARDNGGLDAAFAPPKFFPMSDHVASTGLESLFDKAFTIKSPEDEDHGAWQSQQQATSAHPQPSVDLHSYFVFQYLRLGLLLSSIGAWLVSQYDHISLPGDYIEVASLGSASLIAGFALLEALKRPLAQWNGMEILVYFAELVAAVHLGGNLPQASYQRHYFDRYGKLLLIFMTVQEALGLISLYRFSSAISTGQVPPENQAQPPTTALPSVAGYPNNSPGSENSNSQEPQAFALQSSVPPLSFSSTVTGSSFSAQTPEARHNLPFSSYDGGHHNYSFSLKSLKGEESDVSDPLDRDSDTETTVTTATTATNNTIRNIRYGQRSSDAFFSPKRSELGPGIGGLSLDDEPSRRMTRSQTQRLRRFPGRGLK
ncbi:Ima1 N-terminal domain-containing protein [Aspergillus coremiiformis]|uniref:Ima1 N-terminal domain-containing protein n=1 Tax=Aspergillus coremiiformis TaxID=138285 RepID=A0A5N6YX75_9EURO|nr:Ima1 N-terminal domain-containing protein [Aspergillus coremiiformis]